MKMNSFPIIKILGESLLSQKGIVQTASICGKDKYIGFYYSASWCSSSKAFTPDLIKFYEQFKDSNRADVFEIVYVSSDYDEKQFKEQFESMPWLSLPFTDKQREKELARHFRVQSIPALVIADASSGEIITSCGRACVIDDPNGLHFPWKMRDPIQVLKETPLVDSNNVKLTFDSLSNSIKGLYFSAHWCPPCKAFTPVLSKLYQKLKKSDLNFQVIFISSDLSEDSFKKYFSTMPWLAVPYSEERKRKELTHLYGVGGIPCLIIMDENNAVITKEGRIELKEDPHGEDFPWKPKLVDELSEKHITKLNEEPCLILFTTCEDKELEFAHYALLPVAEEYQARVKRASLEGAKIQKLNFFYAGDAGICDSVQDIVGLCDDFPILIILDIPNGKKYVHERKDMASDIIGKFVRDFLSSKLTPCVIGK